jgi:glycerophosphoryl diester phosphodiesterase
MPRGPSRERFIMRNKGLGMWVLGLGIGVFIMTITGSAQYSKKTLVAHRGASAYAPEHTAAAYRLAIQMGADFVEQDLAVTKDNVLICIHDPTLERTTNVEEVFPDRASMQTIGGRQRKVWLANDFTLAEIKQLDAGSWMDKKFASEKILTFDEAWEIIHGKAGMFPEIKDPEIYNARHVEFEKLVAAALDKHNLRGPKADPKTPLILQTFDQDTARKLAQMKIGVPVVLLMSSDTGFKTHDDMKAWKGIVQGLGPAKEIVTRNPDYVKWAHAEGMTVTPYTVTTRSPNKKFNDVTAEMSNLLYEIGVDALFTDNPDKFPRKLTP